MYKSIGFMQGRLSPKVNDMIQAFPWHAWTMEFPQAQKIGIGLMEWTLDQEGLYSNPLMTPEGQLRILDLCDRYDVQIPSLTGDCFMQAPFWKASGAQGQALEEDFMAVCRACGTLGIQYVVVPLVDNGRLEDRTQEDRFVGFLQQQVGELSRLGLQVVFESDFSPADLARFIDRLDPVLFGINYDMGNSAAQGWDPREEFAAYGARVLNVHVKDRLLGGTTVPLGTGHTPFDLVFAELGRLKYVGNFILQTARATDERHVEVLSGYRDMTVAWAQKHVWLKGGVN
ncbi:MAG: sugar phosphate isomerase/epimerase [Gammaproteobacteria bacterium]|nr:sugar phosphate isomerase/epimerase [Gammaproteobacteria bacterium]MBU0788303.1 sugar phosphate isomerase/epimerase [Gammaproteobacteria bacterium]MBU0815200.1 sugar phosphate isomerase/epimerase [Gammaproteobacteria bacterium]MBU1785692.1 sugar phosphate isomerase/epimerase [Gammaproteobacteria bacterium]